jgi:hypothetical protein
MTIDKFDPVRVNPGDEDYERLLVAWNKDGRPRRFKCDSINWMQIMDNQGVCFVPTSPSDVSSLYENTSYDIGG